MPKIVPIVEGDGEVEAVPILLRKLVAGMGRPEIGISRHPLNAHSCRNLTKPGGLERFVQNAALRPDCGAILVLMDADKGCPLRIAQDFVSRINRLGTKHPVAVVIAKCEYEAWFLASLDSIVGNDLEGRAGLPIGTVYSKHDVESLVGVKGWLSRAFPGSQRYKETLDQAPMTRLLKPELVAPRSRSFRRLAHALNESVASMDRRRVAVTPAATEPTLDSQRASESGATKTDKKVRKRKSPNEVPRDVH